MLFPQFRQADAGVQRQLEDEASQLVGRRVRDLTGRTHEEVRVVLESGSPNAGILRVAEETRAGVLVVGPGGARDPGDRPHEPRGAGGVGTVGRTGLAHLALGSVAEAVVSRRSLLDARRPPAVRVEDERFRWSGVDG